jgi:hypothetical protein
MSVFSFPLFSPVAAPIGAFCAGRLSRRWALSWDYGGDRRLDFVSRIPHPRSATAFPRGQALPLVSRASA